jgi:hypothetical protein
MQPSEFFRRSIVLPKSKAARMILEVGQFNPSLAEEYQTICIGPEFDIIWGSGLFSDINNACSSHISDYEDDDINYDRLPAIVNLLDQKYARPSMPILYRFCRRLKNLCLEGIENQMPLYFIF